MGKQRFYFAMVPKLGLFENTEFQIQEASEQGAGERSFRRKLFLRFGAFLNNFFGRSDHTVIETPYYQLKPEGTSFHVQASKEQGSAALFQASCSFKMFEERRFWSRARLSLVSTEVT